MTAICRRYLCEQAAEQERHWAAMLSHHEIKRLESLSPVWRPALKIQKVLVRACGYKGMFLENTLMSLLGPRSVLQTQHYEHTTLVIHVRKKAQKFYLSLTGLMRQRRLGPVTAAGWPHRRAAEHSGRRLRVESLKIINNKRRQ